MNYYGINYPRGVRGGITFYKFPTRADRDKWVAEGGGSRFGRDYREPVDAADPELQTELRYEKKHGLVGWHVIDVTRYKQVEGPSHQLTVDFPAGMEASEIPRALTLVAVALQYATEDELLMDGSLRVDTPHGQAFVTHSLEDY